LVEQGFRKAIKAILSNWRRGEKYRR